MTTRQGHLYDPETCRKGSLGLWRVCQELCYWICFSHRSSYHGAISYLNCCIDWCRCRGQWKGSLGYLHVLCREHEKGGCVYHHDWSTAIWCLSCVALLRHHDTFVLDRGWAWPSVWLYRVVHLCGKTMVRWGYRHFEWQSRQDWSSCRRWLCLLCKYPVEGLFHLC